MSAGAFDPRHGRSLADPRGQARRISELERRLARLEAQVGPPGRRVFWAELSGPVSAASPPTTGVNFSIVVPGVYLVATQFTSYTNPSAGLSSKELWVDDTMLNATGQFMNTVGAHHTVGLEGAFIELATGTHFVAARWSGTNAVSDSNDRISFWAWRTA